MPTIPPDDLSLEQPDDEQELFEHHRFSADKGQDLLRIDKFLLNRIENASRTKIQAAAESGNILVNGKAVKSNYRIKPFDVVQIVMPNPPRNKEIIPQDIPLTIVYEDDSLVVINKQPGLVVHPGYGNYSGTLVNALMFHFQNLPQLPGNEIPRPGLVHRLDKDTSGIMVMAKTEIAMMKLAAQFFHRTSKRTYQALVWGNPEQDSGTIVGHIGRSIRDRKVFDVFEDESQGRHAITHYQVLERFSYVSLIECKLETGRTHQIRVHLQHIGHPLFMDETYGGNRILKGTTFAKYKQFVENCFEICPRQALHAKSLGFVHPVSGQDLHFDSELPADMEALIEKWRKYVT
jgi:23S rRNA pseudouridine1911/1915/1917 synthase